MFASNVVTSNRLRSAPLRECQNNCSCYDSEFFRGPTIPSETAEAIKSSASMLVTYLSQKRWRGTCRVSGVDELTTNKGKQKALR
jgi:hypothetical protein